MDPRNVFAQRALGARFVTGPPQFAGGPYRLPPQGLQRPMPYAGGPVTPGMVAPEGPGMVPPGVMPGGPTMMPPRPGMPLMPSAPQVPQQQFMRQRMGLL